MNNINNAFSTTMNVIDVMKKIVNNVIKVGNVTMNVINVMSNVLSNIINVVFNVAVSMDTGVIAPDERCWDVIKRTNDVKCGGQCLEV